MEVKTDKKNKRRPALTAMKFFRRTVGYKLFDHKRKQEILKELKEKRVGEKLRIYKTNGL
jgi:hypothetical protein